MAQTTNDMLYLSCTGCNLKFHNDDEHIKQDFGYDRLGRTYKSCVKCRERYAKYRETHREERRECAKQYHEENQDKISDKNKLYKEQHKEELKEKSK